MPGDGDIRPPMPGDGTQHEQGPDEIEIRWELGGTDEAFDSDGTELSIEDVEQGGRDHDNDTFGVPETNKRGKAHITEHTIQNLGPIGRIHRFSIEWDGSDFVKDGARKSPWIRISNSVDASNFEAKVVPADGGIDSAGIAVKTASRALSALEAVVDGGLPTAGEAYLAISWDESAVESGGDKARKRRRILFRP